MTAKYHLRNLRIEGGGEWGAEEKESEEESFSEGILGGDEVRGQGREEEDDWEIEGTEETAD